ncbi:pyridoxamine 5'-phosphate oxidase family protein [Streptomyces peucetius]|uniref:Pyridoxamine 5'-phosphate oxidase family protein n=1 Tax=Streptomyces peucetius TaxID=1950 RepID=A0ABY6I584_STRPE|nr:pyridoxamine 5'-phosphate oxidase family protein [Streptomyces peucetius]UYQ62078.1 pyridoxamine 5'-phosphate oxidase family protein [Streptomyces peucetius]
MTTQRAARSREERRRHTLDRLAADNDAWVATASADGTPCLMPLSFVWDGASLLMCTRRTNPTARVTPRGEAVVTLGHTRDVVHVEGRAEVVEGSALAAETADAFAAKLNWDPRDRRPWVYLRITPRVVKVWREENELKDRLIMVDGRWLD